MTDTYVEQFKERWHDANERGMEGHRVEYALQPLIAEVERLRRALNESRAEAAEVERLRAERETLHNLLRDMTDPDPCDWDHNHSCQAHGYFYLPQGVKCPHQEAKELLDDESI